MAVPTGSPNRKHGPGGNGMAAQAGTASTLKQEVAIGQRHTPDFAWPTVALALGLFAAYGAVTYAAIAELLPLPAAILLNALFIYGFYTVVHEAVHHNISGRHRERRWVDRLLGTLCCFPLWQFMDHHKRSHQLHHAHANRDDDPDIYVRGGLAGWLFVRLPKALLSYFNPLQLYRECRRFRVPAPEIRLTFLTFAANTAVVVALVALGHGYELLMLWFLPWYIGQTAMLTFFTWTPHHDFTETGRYRDTRISLWPGADLILLGQNLHLIHHMLPRVPFYRYRAVFEEMRPLLERNGARIEGFWPETAASRSRATPA